MNVLLLKCALQKKQLRINSKISVIESDKCSEINKCPKCRLLN